MTDREAPSSPEQLYEDVGDALMARPLLQGDVFRDVVVPGFDQDEGIVMITQHPCSMRAGASLRKRLTVAVVRRRNMPVTASQWQGYGSAMLLPNLLGDGADYEADFRDTGVVLSESLHRIRRLAALTNYGVSVLQQRLVFYLTRLTVDLPTLADAFEDIAAETELQWEWTEAALSAAAKDADPEVVLGEAEKLFAEYLDANGKERRRLLKQSETRVDIRRQIRREIGARYGEVLGNQVSQTRLFASSSARAAFEHAVEPGRALEYLGLPVGERAQAAAG